MNPLLQKISFNFHIRRQTGSLTINPSYAGSLNPEEQGAPDFINSGVPAGSGRKCDLKEQWWNPIWLHPLSIAAFAVFATALAASVFALWYDSRKDHGIQIISNNHYLWTYGPTAILVLIVAAWRQIDYHCKSLTPWAALQRERTSASSSILLDYVSPLQAISFARSVKLGHTPVIASVSGFVLLKLITLASTGLLEPGDVTVTNTDLVLRTSRLNGSLFNRTEYIARPDSSLVYNAYGTAAFRLDTPDGLDRQGFVYETFDWPDARGQTNLSVTAQVNALIPSFSCQRANVSLNPDSSGTSTDPTMSIISPFCELTGSADPTFIIDQNILETTVCPTVQRRGMMQAVNCSNDGQTSTGNQLLVLAELLYQQEFDGDVRKSEVGKKANVTSGSVNIGRVESIVCRPSYSVVETNATYNPSKQLRPSVKLSFAGSDSNLELQRLQKSPKDRKLDGFSEDDLTLTFRAALLDAADLFGEATDDEFAEDFPNTLFKMMAGSASDGYASLFGTDQKGRSELAVAAQNVFSSITGQVVTKNLRQPRIDDLPAQISYVERRLVVNDLAVWAMLGGFVLVAIIAVILGLTLPRNVIPCLPESRLGSTEILSESADFEELVKNNAAHDTDTVEESLQHCDFASTSFVAYKHSAIPFSIDVFKSLPAWRIAKSRKKDHHQQKLLDNQWWKPLVLRRSLTFLTLILPLLTLVALEIVHRLSRETLDGIPLSIGDGEVPNAALLSRLIPALMMLLIATMVNAVDFNIALLAPFTALKQRAVRAANDLGRPLVGELPIIALWKAVRMRWWSASASALAGLIGSLLTIVVSGLYTIDPMPRTESLALAKTQVLNVSLLNAKVEDGSAASLLSLLESANLSLPASTYDDLTFPMLGASYETTTNMLSANTSISVEVPALQASLDCSPLTPQDMEITTSYNLRILTSSVSVSARVSLPPTCQRGGPDGDLPLLEISPSFPLPENASYIGKLLDLHVGPYDDILGSSADEIDSTQPDNPPGCPSLAFVYGYADVNNPDVTAVNTLICTQHIKQVDTRTFLTPQQVVINSTIISPANIPYLPASASDNSLTAFPFRIQLPLDASLSLFNQTIFPSAANAQTPVDSFFQGVLFGKTPLYPDHYTALASTSDNDRKTVLEAIQAFYGRYMAQAMSVSARQPLAKSATAAAGVDDEKEVWNVTVYDNATQYILTQHPTSKLVLQVMLVAMTGLMAFAVIDLERGERMNAVKYNPCTIWGRMALVAGSDLVKKSGGRSMEGRLVKLGWKEDQDGGGRRWCVDYVDDEKAGSR